MLAVLMRVGAGTVSEPSENIVRRPVMLLPVRNITDNLEYASLSYTIFNVFTINLKKQESLVLLEDTLNIAGKWETNGFDRLIRGFEKAYEVETCVMGEYYVSNEVLTITVTVVDVVSRRIKGCYVKSMPSDQGRYDILDRTCGEIAVAIARELPALDREAVMQKEITSRLRQKLDADERLLDSVLKKHHEFRFYPLTGLSLGRTIISWSASKPSLFIPLRIEYTWLFGETWHFSAGLEYQIIDVMVEDIEKTEAGIDLLVGLHSRSLFSVGVEAGVALTYDYNASCSALASEEDTAPAASRISFSIPLVLSLAFNVDPVYFIGFRLVCYGLTWTYESSAFSDYTDGNEKLLYANGFSPLNFVCLALHASIGVRF
ncbi:MAG: hypothetical protein JW881_09005 [Spirochaetales bacterium]|nr:hypothetical protein [Spirochaetales bacterium]